MKFQRFGVKEGPPSFTKKCSQNVPRVPPVLARLVARVSEGFQNQLCERAKLRTPERTTRPLFGHTGMTYLLEAGHSLALEGTSCT